MRIDIITIFPEYFGPLRVSLIGKAAERGDIQFGCFVNHNALAFRRKAEELAVVTGAEIKIPRGIDRARPDVGLLGVEELIRSRGQRQHPGVGD